MDTEEYFEEEDLDYESYDDEESEIYDDAQSNSTPAPIVDSQEDEIVVLNTSPKSKTCMVCTYLNYESAKRCSMCRAELTTDDSKSKTCSKCSSSNHPQAVWCTVCDSLLIEGEQGEEKGDNGEHASSSSAALNVKGKCRLEERACPSCTLLNDYSAKVCTACGAILQAGPVSRTQETLEGPSQVDTKEVIDLEEPSSSEGKACAACTLINKKYASVCTACETPFEDCISKKIEVQEPLRDCVLCGKENKELCYSLQICSHPCCRECIVQFVGSNISNFRFDYHEFMGVICPVQNCGKFLSRQDVRAIAGIDVVTFLDSHILEGTKASPDKYLSNVQTAINGLKTIFDEFMEGGRVNPEVKLTEGKKANPRKKQRRSARDILGSMKQIMVKNPEVEKAKQNMDGALIDSLNMLSEGISSALDEESYLLQVLVCVDPRLTTVLAWLLRNDSTLDISERSGLYFQVFTFFRVVIKRPELYPLVYKAAGKTDCWMQDAEQDSLMNLFEKLHKQATFIMNNRIPMDSEVDENSAVEAALVAESKFVFEDLEERISVWKAQVHTHPWFHDAHDYFTTRWPIVSQRISLNNNASGSTTTNTQNEEKEKEKQEYVNALKPIQFAQASLLEKHYFRDKINWDINNNNRFRRISKEMAGLATNMPLEYHSSIHVRVDQCRLDILRALIIGPEDTPYENGIFLFDIKLPDDYPHSPPAVQFLTTASGTVRFNPNLYNCGKVCLSLLGTWDGPRWASGASTVLQVLVSLQSLVFVKEPYCNEPGYVNQHNTPQSRAYSIQQQYNTLLHSILPALRNPDADFADLIMTHFRLKRKAIEKQCDKWKQCVLHGHHNLTMEQVADMVVKELADKFD